MYEIERKWLLGPAAYIPADKQVDLEGPFHIQQAYLAHEGNTIVRVRRSSIITEGKFINTGEITYKSGSGLMRLEKNIIIDESDAAKLLAIVPAVHILSKMRWRYKLDKYTAEVDIITKNDNRLYLVEIEFPSVEEAKAFVAPDYFGEEVTHDNRYTNFSISRYGIP